jgi:membrane glycosyltransferase
MRARRASFLVLVVVTIGALAALMVRTLDVGGLDVVDYGLLAAFGLTLPWTAVGFWNAVIGLVLMLRHRDPARSATPVAALGLAPAAIDTRTALLVCIRNEDPQRLERNLDAMLSGLAALPEARQLEVALLSDSDRPDLLPAESALAQTLAARYGAHVPVSYRRRTDNAGFKAGNLREFCERRGRDFDLAVVLDADSVMSPAAILRLIRVMQEDPRLGIVQTLVVGLPSASPFARLFQFGMRLGMRSYTLGSAWWQGDCGPYWGHNAIIRLAPFIEHCALPDLPGRGPLSGCILSHDQVEAVLMRRAGYAVRVLPMERGSWEENPPTLLEFMRRDLRWCQGNMQYWRLLAMPGLHLLGRIQLLLAILMFIGSPAWIAFVLLATFRDLLLPANGPAFRPDTGLALFTVVLVMSFAPKIASVLAVLASRERRQEFGAPSRFLAGVAAETVFAVALAPVMAVVHTVFIAGLVFGRTIGWTAQVRDGHSVPLREALRALWRPTLLGAVLCVWFIATAPALIPWAAPFWLPLLLCAPFASLTAWPALGTALTRARIAAIPEEIAPPAELVALKLPALVGHTGANAAPTPDARAGSASASAASTLRTAMGIARSVWIYRVRDPARRRRMDALNARFVQPGALAFDLGSHVGDRVDSFLRLGCRVVAVEPQPALLALLRTIYRGRAEVVIEPLAAGEAEGEIELHLNIANPTVATGSTAFIASAAGAPGWEGQRWSARTVVPLTTLDRLVARHGRPAFVKIDVEGLEDRVLRGLTRPVPALSFEFTTIQRDVALAALRRCAELGRYRFDATLGESHTLVHGRWLEAEEMAKWLAELPVEANSGDVYAVLEVERVEGARGA